ncbi:unnamed protein product [Rotaria sp. Silwood1]|nr:unnamed protein product [Rotaria sp. Silwood1]
MPNLIFLNVIVRKSSALKRSPVPRLWPRQLMMHLTEFRIKTEAQVIITFDHLRGMVMPLIQLEKFTLDVKQWISNEKQFVKGDQIEMLFSQFMPRLRQFHCFIQTAHNIDMQTFATLSKRWPLACKLKSNGLCQYLYTIPWSFEQLDISMLADDDTISICPNIRYLTVDVPCTDLSRRFPNIHTLNVLVEYNISGNDHEKFRRLRHLKTTNINMISFLPTKRIQTLTLLERFKFLKDTIIYSNVLHLILEKNKIKSLNTVIKLVKCFPNLRSLKIQLKNTDEYYNCLDVLLDGEHLPHLWLFKTNWISRFGYCSKISVWISANTPLRWRSTPFYGYCDYNELTICL